MIVHLYAEHLYNAYEMHWIMLIENQMIILITKYKNTKIQ